MELRAYITLCDALVLLMMPLLEIVIHDLESNTICYINGSLSKRKIGDPSLLEKDEFETEIDKLVYKKINFNGSSIKSVSVPINNKYLLCINFDLSVFESMQELSNQFLKIQQSSKPESLFKNDWQEKLHEVIHDFLKENNWDFNALKGKQKKELTFHLFTAGAFQEKKAADYIATILSLGRATVFKYLKEWRNDDT